MVHINDCRYTMKTMSPVTAFLIVCLSFIIVECLNFMFSWWSSSPQLPFWLVILQPCSIEIFVLDCFVPSEIYQWGRWEAKEYEGRVGRWHIWLCHYCWSLNRNKLHKSHISGEELLSLYVWWHNDRTQNGFSVSLFHQNSSIHILCEKNCQ